MKAVISALHYAVLLQKVARENILNVAIDGCIIKKPSFLLESAKKRTSTKIRSFWTCD